MSSSFKKALKSKNVDSQETSTRRSVKPWSGTAGMVSCGHRELDELLGGGHVLGTYLSLFSDTYTDYGMTIMRYSVAEGVAMGHRVLVVNTDVGSAEDQSDEINDYDAVLGILPFNLNAGVDDKTSDNESDSHNEVKAKPELNIAWQYTKYIENQPNQTEISKKDLNTYCCSYDLAKRVQGSLLLDNAPRFIKCSHKDSINPFFSLLDGVRKELETLSSGQIARLFVPHLEKLFLTASEREVCRFVLALKHICRAAKVTLTSITHIPSISSTTGSLFALADTALSMESFAGRLAAIPREFKDLSGLLYVRQNQQLGSVASPHPPYDRYGLKRDRRKLLIVPLHLPPEESRAFGAAGTDARAEARAADLKSTKQHSDVKANVASSSESKLKLHIEEDNRLLAATPKTLSSLAVDSKKNSLAASFAAARAARQAGKANTNQNPALAPGIGCSTASLQF